MRIGKYPLSLVENMDETPAFFDMVPSKCIAAKGTKECVVRTLSGEKKTFYSCFVSYGGWENAPTNDYFQGKN